MSRDSFIFYRSFFEASLPLEAADKLALFEAITHYALNQEITELTPIAKAMFTLIRPQLDANHRRYENGKKGGKPKTELEPKDNLDGTKGKANKNVNANVNPNPNVNDNPPTPLGKEGLKIKNWDILRVISDKGLSKAKANAPGWDIYNLAGVYNGGVAERGVPDKPDLAFAGWCAKYTKGKEL